MAGQLDDGNAFFQEWPDRLKTFTGTFTVTRANVDLFLAGKG
jgi:hypothetical protein